MIRRIFRNARSESPAMVDAWVVTFTDLLTLLVTLFVLLISMSTFRQGYVAGAPNVDWSQGRAHTPHTSWQMSQPKIQFSNFPFMSAGSSSFNSMVK